MPYPKNFAVRLIICIVGTIALWMIGRYVGIVLIRHEAFSFDASDIIAPAVVGVIEANAWKPKGKE